MHLVGTSKVKDDLNSSSTDFSPLHFTATETGVSTFSAGKLFTVWVTVQGIITGTIEVSS